MSYHRRRPRRPRDSGATRQDSSSISTGGDDGTCRPKPQQRRPLKMQVCFTCHCVNCCVTFSFGDRWCTNFAAAGALDLSRHLLPSGAGIPSRGHSVGRCRQCIRCYKVTFTDNCFLLIDSFLMEIVQIINDDVILPGSSGRKLSSMTINVRISHVVSSSLSLKLFITFRRKLYGRKKIVS